MSQVPTCPEPASPPSRLKLPALILTVAALFAVSGLVYLNYGAHAEETAPVTLLAPKETTPVAAAAPRPMNMADDESRIRAPELDGGTEWLNCAGPIRLKDLRGKIVLLDFWTYCCINCIHVVPDLEKLEKKYANQLVVIGVHSAKFDTEKDSKNIREAILRYNIEHPVVNDADHKIWNAYAVRSWPTFYLIDPEGYIYGRGSGEGLFDALDVAIDKLIRLHREKKTLNEQPLRFDLAKFSLRKTSPLFFPGKVLADPAGRRLFIADSSHHRIVVTDLDGKKIAVAGTGQPGLKDGPFAAAAFNDPQGMALHGEILYVADRKNHVIRALDLRARTVTTVAGTGEQGQDRRASGDAKTVALNSPWDLWRAGNTLYIAMAGHHQIWKLDLKAGQVGPFAGNGREDILDGTLVRSMFAQPSGLTSDGLWLYVADSEVSAVRAVSLRPDGTVKTLVGTGLFEFGDVDGVAEKVRLQHCLGVAWYDGKLYVADTYNNKLKVIDPAKRECVTFLGDGQPGHTDDPPRFDEPAGISVGGELLYVADTNNHAIRVVHLRTKAVRTLKLEGVEPPAAPKPSARPVFPNPVRTKLATAVIPAAGEVTVQVTIRLPKGSKLSPQAPIQYVIETAEGGPAGAYEQIGQVDKSGTTFALTVPADKLAGAKTLKVSLVYYPCQVGGEGVCQIKSHVWEIPLTVDAARKESVIQLTASCVPK